MLRTRIKLVTIAHGKSGDKGNVVNIGLVALTAESYPALLREVTVERLREHFGDAVQGEIRRYELPGIRAINVVLGRALGGGSTNSTRLDVFGHDFAPRLLRMEIEVEPSELPTLEVHG